MELLEAMLDVGYDREQAVELLAEQFDCTFEEVDEQDPPE